MSAAEEIADAAERYAARKTERAEGIGRSSCRERTRGDGLAQLVAEAEEALSVRLDVEVGRYGVLVVRGYDGWSCSIAAGWDGEPWFLDIDRAGDRAPRELGTFAEAYAYAAAMIATVGLLGLRTDAEQEAAIAAARTPSGRLSLRQATHWPDTDTGEEE